MKFAYKTSDAFTLKCFSMLRFAQRILLVFNLLVKFWIDGFIVNQRNSILYYEPNLQVLQLKLSKQSSVLFFVGNMLQTFRFIVVIVLSQKKTRYFI